LQVEALAVHPTARWPIPVQGSSHQGSVTSARSYKSQERAANPTAALRELAALVEHGLFDELVCLE
jgi:hypothetical protein